ncbi:LamG domain-containing protein [Micromonospora sp. CA-240977]|uniref:LamG domain-containing protein n=1 Tax=Micromonospora sp. CA-240977 TaxID=3239957 RepID=UPI003D8A79F6
MIKNTLSIRPARGSARKTALRLAVAFVAASLPLAGATTASAKPRPVTVLDRHSGPTAIWGLEAFPGISQAAGLSDQQPAVGGDTPLVGSDISWQDDARMVGGQAVAFNGTSSYLSASPTALNTAGTFSLAAWVRLTDTSVSRVFASKAGAGRASLSVGYDRRSNRWQVQMPSTTGKGARGSVARSNSAPQIGLWTHLAVVHDATARTVTLLVNGIAEATATSVAAVNDPSGPVRLGRGDDTWWQGNVAAVQVYDRVLVGQDFTGWLASDPASGGFNESGLLDPRWVGDWNFDGAVVCYEDNSLDPTLCSAPDSTAFGRQLTLSRGVDVVFDGRRGSSTLALDHTHWIDDPSDPHYGEETWEYARSQTNVAHEGNPVWEDGPVLRSDQSFTVSTWVRLDAAEGAQTVVSQEDADRSAFRLAYEPDNGGQWRFDVADVADASTSATTPATAVDGWHQLVAILDVGRRQARLYVDGALATTVGLHEAWQPWQATGSLLVGRSTTPEGPAEWLNGQVDDVTVYQGMLSDARVQYLFMDQQS